jgi:hypothetical protein
MFWIGLAIYNLIGVGVIYSLWRDVKKIGPGTYSGVLAAGYALYALAVLAIMILGSSLAIGILCWSIYWPDSFSVALSYLTFTNSLLLVAILLLVVLLRRSK